MGWIQNLVEEAKSWVASSERPRRRSPVYCRLHQIVGLEKEKFEADQILSRNSIKGETLVVLAVEQGAMLYGQCNFRFAAEDEFHFKFVDHLESLDPCLSALVQDFRLKSIVFVDPTTMKLFTQSRVARKYRGLFKLEAPPEPFTADDQLARFVEEHFRGELKGPHADLLSKVKIQEISDGAEKALETLERAMPAKCDDLELLNVESALLAKLGRFEENLERWRPIAAKLHSQPELAAQAPIALIALGLDGQAEKAIPLARRALAQDAENFHLRASLAFLLKLAHRHEEALALFEAFDESHQASFALLIADSYLASELPSEALESLNRGLLSQPDDVRLLRLKSKTLGQLGRWPEATETVDYALGIEPEDPTLRVQKLEAIFFAHDTSGFLEYFNSISSEWEVIELLLQNENLLIAMDALLEGMDELENRVDYWVGIQKNLPGNVTLARRVGWILIDGESEKTLEWIDQALAQFPLDPELASQKVSILLTLEKKREAGALIKRVLQSGKADREQMSRLASLSSLCLKDEEFLAAIKKYLRHQPKDRLRLAAAGVALMERASYEQALPFLRESVELRPAPHVLADLSLALVRLGQHQESLECAELALAMAPKNSRALEVKADNLFTDEHFEQVAELLEPLAEREALSEHGRATYLTALMQTNQHAKAVPILRATIEDHPESAPIYNLLAESLREAGDFEGALEAAMKLVELEPGSDDGLFEVAQAHIELGTPESGLSSFAQLSEKAPESARFSLHYHRARLLEVAERVEEAATTIRLAIELEPQEPMPRMILGRLLAAAGDPEGALKELRISGQKSPAIDRAEEMIELGFDEPALDYLNQPDQPFAEDPLRHYISHEALLHLARRQEALIALDTYLEAESEDGDAWLDRAWLLSLMKRHSEAEVAAQKGLDSEPENLFGLCLLADALRLQDDESGAERIYRTVLEHGAPTDADLEAEAEAEPDTYALYRIGWAHLHLGEAVTAAECFARCLREDPEVSTYFDHGLAKLAAGEDEGEGTGTGAAASYEAAIEALMELPELRRAGWADVARSDLLELKPWLLTAAGTKAVEAIEARLEKLVLRYPLPATA